MVHHSRSWHLLARMSFCPAASMSRSRNDFPTVEWSKEGLQPDVIFLYRDGCETYEMKNPDFQYRTSLIVKELKNRNVSLRISSVRLSDEGKYKCMKLWKDAPREITTVTLVVVAVSEPKLSVVSVKSGGVTLQCEANCWLPKPEISLLDDQGNIIPADEPRRVRDASGCYILTRKVTLRDATKRVTCRVHQPNINQTRSTEILIPVKEHKLRRQSSDQSAVSFTSENHPFLQNDRTDNVKNCTTEKLRREVAALKSKLYEKEKTIHQLQNDSKRQLSPVVCQLGRPTFVCGPSKYSPDVQDPFNSPTNKNYNPKPTASTYSNPPEFSNLPQHQCPHFGISQQDSNPEPGRPFHRSRRANSIPANLNLALSLTSSSNASKKKLGDIGRSKSASSAWPGPNASKPQRRNSGFLASSFNRFTPLSNLSEEPVS
ncbi:hypothetical protein L3Q82_016505 [Scortum barcoo]|uniref:Uncharacterized protein n=1 Tax=Scortum barcoo TaxID=214431 RepID=A0ACB8X6L3_9TELE|nr:hypothetical protein L3Q82_016505 [Scortum barcoo]